MENNQSNQELEHEVKALLTEDQYLKLLSFLKLKKEQMKSQTNSYFDTEEFVLEKNDAMLRVRMKKGEYELTIKEKAEAGARNETNHRPFSESQRSDLYLIGVVPEGNVKEVLDRFGFIPPYLCLGDLHTDRIEIPYKGCKLALDYNKYLSKEDYEVEAERDNPEADEVSVLLELLKDVDIPYEEALPKAKRFLNQKRFLMEDK